MSLSEQASDWLLRLQMSSDDPTLKKDFEAWLSASPEHQKAWQKISRTWTVLSQVPSSLTLPQTSSLPEQDMPVRVAVSSVSSGEQQSSEASEQELSVAVRQPLWKSRSVWAGALLAACLCAWLVPGWLLLLEADYRTSVDEIRTVSLSDGSEVTLAGNSAIAVDVTESSRSVRLLTGEAFFDVAHDASKPFTVKADTLNVSVLGTSFDVRLGADAADVSLLEGRVHAASSNAIVPQGLHLHPGERLRLLKGSSSADSYRVEDVALEEIGAWRKGRLFVTNATVRSVVEQIGRYHNAWISVDPLISSTRITGVYDLSQPDRALNAVVSAFGGRVLAVSPYVRVLVGF